MEVDAVTEAHAATAADDGTETPGAEVPRATEVGSMTEADTATATEVGTATDELTEPPPTSS